MMLQKKTYTNNANWLQILDHSYRILVIGGSGSGKTNSLFNLISHQPNINKIYLCVKDAYKANYQLLIKKRKYKNETFT